jgi:hypothetical protein
MNDYTLFDAMVNDDVQRAKDLLDAGHDPNDALGYDPDWDDTVNSLDASAIINYNSIGVLELFIEYGWIENVTDYLLEAMLHGSWEMFIMLLQYASYDDLDASLRLDRGWVVGGHIIRSMPTDKNLWLKKIQIIIDEGGDITSVDKYGKTPLDIAKEQGFKEYYDLLLLNIQERHKPLKKEIIKKFREKSLKQEVIKAFKKGLDPKPGSMQWAQFMGEAYKMGMTKSVDKIKKKCMTATYIDHKNEIQTYTRDHLYFMAKGMGLKPTRRMTKAEMCYLITHGVRFQRQAPF